MTSKSAFEISSDQKVHLGSAATKIGKFCRPAQDPREMLNNFCFHVYAQKSLFIGKNGTAFFYFDLLTHTRAKTVHRAGSQLITQTAITSLKK